MTAAAYVLDSYALLAYVRDEPGADRVQALLEKAARGELSLLLTAVNYGEIAYTIQRKAGAEAARYCTALLDLLPLQVVAVDEDLALAAARFKAQYPMAYADCFCLALAEKRQATVVTGDPEFHQVETAVSLEWLPEKAKRG